MRTTVANACALLTAVVAGCSSTSARDVLVHGRVSDGNGQPIAGLQVYLVDIKNRIGMPGVGERFHVYTDAEGRYSVTFRKLHSTLGITITDPGNYIACPNEDVNDLAPSIDKSVFAGTHEVNKDLVICSRTANHRWSGP